MKSGSIKRTGEAGSAGHISPLLKVALLLGVLAHLSGFFLFSVISNPLPSRVASDAFIALVPTNLADDEDELIEQASLFDSAPLFVPGEWSSASRVFSAKTLKRGQVFPDYEPDLELAEEVRPERLMLQQSVVVEQPSDLLDLRFWDMFSYFGQKEFQVEKPEGWRAVGIVTIISGNKDYPEGFERRLEVDMPSEAFAARPIIFFLNMSAPGLPLGAPVLKQSSGSDELDAAAMKWLNRPEVLAKLPAGFLKIRVFP